MAYKAKDVTELLKGSDQEKAFDKSIELWNAFIDIPEDQKHSDDTDNFRKAVNDIQRILITQHTLSKL